MMDMSHGRLRPEGRMCMSGTRSSLTDNAGREGEAIIRGGRLHHPGMRAQCDRTSQSRSNAGEGWLTSLLTTGDAWEVK